MQWHPLFACLLRLVLQDYYDVWTNVPVGDVPREADIVLLRRRDASKLPFHGLWRYLTRWNVLEFKGPTGSARGQDLDLLVELGLGVHRRLGEQSLKEGQRPPGNHEVSFWYLVNRFGPRFLRLARQRLGALKRCGPGVWRGKVLGHPVFLVSNVDLPIDRENMPLQMVSFGDAAREHELARFVLSEEELTRTYSPWLSALHQAAKSEVEIMRTAEPQFDLKRLIDFVGVRPLVRDMGLDRVIAEVGLDRVIAEVGLDRVISALSPEQRQELQRRLAKGDLGQVAEAVDLDHLVETLTPEQRRELRRRLSKGRGKR